MVPLPLPVFVPQYLPQTEPGAWFGHLAFGHDLAAALRPALLVDLTKADAYFGFCQTVVQEGLDCICYAGLSDDLDALEQESLAAYNAIHYSAFSRFIDADRDRRNFSDLSIDLLHVDRAADFDAWLPKVKPGGLVLTGGIAARQESDTWRLWERAEAGFSERFAFHHSGGLGVLRKPGGNVLEAPFLKQLFESAKDADARRQTAEELAKTLGGGLDTAAVLREFLSSPGETQEYIRRHYAIYSGYLDGVLRKDGAAQGLNKKIEELLTEVRAAQHERMILEVDLRQTQFDRNDARRTAESMQARAEAAQASLDKAVQESRTRELALQEEIDRLAAILQSERQVFSATVNSLSWKITAPLRKFMAKVRK